MSRLAATDIGKQEYAEFQKVISGEEAEGVEHVVVAEAGNGAATVWALDGQGRLLMTSRPTGTSEWEPALSLRSEVREIAPVSGDKHLTTSVLVVYKKGQAGYLWRDSKGIWQEEIITVADYRQAASLLTFQTVVTLRDDADLPRGNIKVRIGASVASTLIVNGHSHFVCPGHDASVEVPFDGKISIINRALSFSPATYRLKVPNWPRAIDINPAFALYESFGKLSAQDLRAAKTPSGEPLLGKDYCSGNKKDAVDTLLLSLRKAAELMTSKGGNDGVWQVEEKQDYSSKLNAGTLPDDYCWGLASDAKGGLNALDAAAAKSLAARAGRASAGAFGVNLSISDIWESFLNGAKKAVSFVIRKAADVVEFICDIGGKVGRFILNTIEEIGAFFKWVWQAIKAKAEEAWNFLKFLFDWEDIIAVRDKLKEVLEDQLKELASQILKLKDKVGKTFDDGLAAVRKLAREHNVPASREELRKPGSGAMVKAQKSSGDVRDSVTNSGPGSWIMDQFSALSKSLITIDLPESSVAPIDLEGLFRNQLTRLSDLCGTIGADVDRIFGPKGPSLRDIDFDKIKSLILSVTLRIGEAALAATKDLAMALIDALASLVDIFRRIMFARVRIPLIEKLWELATGKKENLSFSIADVTLLPAAVLGTITFKLVFPRQDIKKVLKARLPTGSVYGAQSDKLVVLLYFLKDVAATFIGFLSIVMDSGAAMAEQITQSATSTWEWFCWTSSAIAHILAGPSIKHSRNPPALTVLGETLIWMVGNVQIVVRYAKISSAQIAAGAYTALAKGVAAFEVICGIIKIISKTMAYLADREGGYAALELTQYYANTATKVVLNGARLVDDPQTKGLMVVGALAAELFLSLGAGLTHNCLSYTAAAAA